MKVNLFYNIYTTDSEHRNKELCDCLIRNTAVFDDVIYFYGRPTFKEVFEKMKEFPDDVNVFCNSDIYFESVEDLKNIDANECYALTRWNKKGEEIEFFNRIDSQDAWVFYGAPRNFFCDFKPGMWGADNRLAYEIFKAGYQLSNPSLRIKTVHVHEVDSRNYTRTKENTVPAPYKTLQPI